MNRLLTFLQRGSKRGSPALALLFCACIALASGCSNDYQQCVDCPGTPALVPGTFALVAVEGKVLPYNPPNSNVTFVAGDCVTTSEKFTLSMKTVTGTDTVTAVSNGFVQDLNSGSVSFHFAASSVQATALLTGNGFVLTYNGLNLDFERLP
jgi:hypothetical protein